MLSASSFKEHSDWNEKFAQCKSQEELGEYTLTNIRDKFHLHFG